MGKRTAALLLALAAACSDEGGLRLIVDGDLDPRIDMDRLDVELWSRGAQLSSHRFALSEDDRLPLSYRIAAPSERTDSVELAVAPSMGGAAVMRVTREVALLSGRTVEARVCLWRRCVGSDADDCRAGRCELADGDADADADADADDDPDVEVDVDGEATSDGDEDDDPDVETDAEGTGPLTCGEVLDCRHLCGNDMSCAMGCASRVCEPSAVALSDVTGCIGSSCGAACADRTSPECETCVRESCSDEVAACEAARCERTCGEVIECMGDCGNDEVCLAGCMESICPAAGPAAEALFGCAAASCSVECVDRTDAACTSCIGSSCEDEVLECMLATC